MRPGGQMRTKTRPTMLDSLIGPMTRASCELAAVVAHHEDLARGHLAAALRAVGRRTPSTRPAGGVGDVGQVRRYDRRRALRQVALVEQPVVDAHRGRSRTA